MDNCSGYCKKCDVVHSLGEGNTRKYALELIQRLEKERRIDFEAPLSETSPDYSTDCLFGEFRGQMFGVLEYEEYRWSQGFLEGLLLST